MSYNNLSMFCSTPYKQHLGQSASRPPSSTNLFSNSVSPSCQIVRQMDAIQQRQSNLASRQGILQQIGSQVSENQENKPPVQAVHPTWNSNNVPASMGMNVQSNEMPFADSYPNQTKTYQQSGTGQPSMQGARVNMFGQTIEKIPCTGPSASASKPNIFANNDTKVSSDPFGQSTNIYKHMEDRLLVPNVFGSGGNNMFRKKEHPNMFSDCFSSQQSEPSQGNSERTSLFAKKPTTAEEPPTKSSCGNPFAQKPPSQSNIFQPKLNNSQVSLSSLWSSNTTNPSNIFAQSRPQSSKVFAPTNNPFKAQTYAPSLAAKAAIESVRPNTSSTNNPFKVETVAPSIPAKAAVKPSVQSNPFSLRNSTVQNPVANTNSNTRPNFDVKMLSKPTFTEVDSSIFKNPRSENQARKVDITSPETKPSNLEVSVQSYGNHLMSFNISTVNLDKNNLLQKITSKMMASGIMRKYDKVMKPRPSLRAPGVEVTLVRETVNLEPGYTSSFTEYGNGFINNLRISNEHGSVEWPNLQLNPANIDFADSLTILRGEVEFKPSDSDTHEKRKWMNSPCLATFFSSIFVLDTANANSCEEIQSILRARCQSTNKVDFISYDKFTDTWTVKIN